MTDIVFDKRLMSLMWSKIILLWLWVIQTFGSNHFTPCHKPKLAHIPSENIISPDNLPDKKYNINDVPSNLDWRWHNGQRWVTWSRNQHIPNYCGACWAMSSTSALSDRIMILHNNSFPEWSVSPQVLLNCEMDDDGCHGGNPNHVFNYILNNGIPSDTCNQYNATGHDTGNICSELSICSTCPSHNNGECIAVSPFQLWFIKEYGHVHGVTNMTLALQDGPIVCSMAVTQEFMDYKGFGIFNDTTGDESLEHDISLVGYGIDQDSGVSYWIGRNSWGTYWGNNGYFRIVRGTDNLGIEKACVWITPDMEPMWVNYSSNNNTNDMKMELNRVREYKKQQREKEKMIALMKNEKSNVKKKMIEMDIKTMEEHMAVNIGNNSNNNIKKAIGDESGFIVKHERCRLEKEPEIVDVITERLTLLDESDMPDDFSWMNYNGTNYLTLPRNQHIPHYCGSCWAFAVTSAVSDRLNILRMQNGELNIWPEINLAPQVLINENGGGTCGGGTGIGAYQYIYNNGIPDETCQIYLAHNYPHNGIKNSSLNICENCVAGNTTDTFWPGHCYQIQNYTKYYVSQYGHITANSINDMKNEIYQRGPISCGMDVTDEFEAYTSGVFSQSLTNVSINHEISLFGWGQTDDGQNYWWGRNSWGVYWGMEGFFQIQMGSDNLGIETACTFGVASFDAPTKV